MANNSFAPIAQMRYMPYGVSRDNTEDTIQSKLQLAVAEDGAEHSSVPKSAESSDLGWAPRFGPGPGTVIGAAVGARIGGIIRAVTGANVGHQTADMLSS